MPSFYPSQMSTQQLPTPTTSDYGHGYKDACYHGLNDYPHQYSDHRNVAPYEMGPILPDPYDHFSKPGPPSQMYNHPNQAYSSGYLQPMGAPMLTPLRVDERYLSHQGGYNTRYPQGYATEPDEKALGGVSATLDYEMEQMTDFVVETTVGMYDLCASHICIADIDLLRSIRHGTSSSASFRKWVLGVLNATRLPSATILLSLSYLARRFHQLSAEGTLNVTGLSLYRILTTALILGSKFLDDNTFQNKSWAEVSYIPIGEINQDERDWLMGFDHRLHYDTDCADGYDACSELWKSFKSRPVAPAAPLQPIDTNIQRQRSLPRLTPDAYQQQYSKQAFSRFPLDPRLADGAYSTPSTYNPYDPWYGHRSALERSPISAVHTGPHTPDYFGGNGTWASNDRYNRSMVHGYPAMAPYTHQISSYSSGYGSSCYPGSVQQNYWNTHGTACQCSSCRHTNFMPRYGPLVVG